MKRAMNKQTEALMQSAHEARAKYRLGAITHEQAYLIVKDYIDQVNERSTRLAREFGIRPRLATVSGFMR